MPSLRILDPLKVEVVSANPKITTGFGKYVKGKAGDLLAGADAASRLRTNLALVEAGESGLNLSWSGAVPFGQDAVTLSIAAGAKALVGVYNHGMELFENTFMGPKITVPADRVFVSFAIRPSVEVGIQPKIGALTFGFTAGSDIELRCYRPFDLAATATLARAWTDVVENFVVPNTIDDLGQLKTAPAGTTACVSGHGRLQIAASANVAAAFNPLASVEIPKLGALRVAGGVTASVGITATITGDFQIRVQKMDDAIVRLSYHKMAGRGLDVALGASAGPAITFRDKDVLAMLAGGPGGIPGGGKEALVAAGITQDQLEHVEAAMEAGLSRKLEVAVAAQFSSLTQDEAAFLYEIDLNAIDATGSSAIDSALAGDLTALNMLESTPAHGVTVLQSRSDALRKTSIKWRINLVGIVNVLSLTELVRTGTVVHDDESGEVVITDKATRDHVGAITDRKQIRKLLYESALMTLTYKAAQLDVNVSLAAEQSFFFLDAHANHQRMSDFLDAVAALDLIPPAAIEARLGREDDFGRASLQIETTFEQAACERLFASRDGAAATPPGAGVYEEIGRRALGSLIKESDPDAYRRLPLAPDGTLWKTMKDAGQANFRFVLPSPITGGDENRQAVRVAVIAADYSLIVWWAETMAIAASRLADMRAFLRGRTASDLEGDGEFHRKREDLAKSIVKAVSRNQSTFDDPWGLVALFMASDGQADAAATIVSSKLTLSLPTAV